MKRNRTLIFGLLTLLALAFVAAAEAQTTNSVWDAELGFRWLDVEGNEDMYRTQINEEEGFLIRSLTFSTVDFDGRFQGVDHFRLDIDELGAGPAGFLRLETGKADAYKLRLTYRQADMYSALPALANPFIGAGIVPGQHTIDRNRTTLDADLELLPWRRITPFVGFTWLRNDGPGTTTYTLGGDDFLLASDLEETDTEVRAGFAFNLTNFHGQITQGWRDLDADETLSLFPGAGGGNNPGLVNQRPVTAATITRSSETSVESPFTNAYVTGQLGRRVRLIGDFVTYDAEATGFEDESAAGSFASFGIRRFFEGLEESVVSNAETKAWRGGLRAEVAIVDNVDFIAGWETRSRELAGSALIETLFLDTINFSGADPRDIEEILATDNSLERDEDILRAGVRARAIGPFTAWAFYSQSQQDLTLTPDVAEISVPGSQGGTFERTVDSIEIGASFARAGFNLTGSFRTDDADTAIVRTDFADRDRVRLRASWASPNRMFRIGATADQTDRSNDRAGIGYDSEIQRLSADFEIAPIEALQLWASYSDFQADSTILFRRPETFVIDTSIHTEDGEAIEGGFRLFVRRVSLEASTSLFENAGTNPFEVDRWRARLGYRINDRYGVAGEWNHDEYTETALPLADYEATRFGVFLRITR